MTRNRSHKKGKGGFTLIEMTFVLAIIAVIAAFLLPLAMARLADADKAKADADIQEIGQALTAFFTDLGHFPACGRAGSGTAPTDCSPMTDARDNLRFLAVGAGADSLGGSYPEVADGTGWDFTGSDDATAPARNNAYNHLFINDPLANGISGQDVDYRTSGAKRWRGPYLARLGLDPWGNAYIIHVGAMEAGGNPFPFPNSRGWILSAGPNGVLETAVDGDTLVSDDRGFIFYNAQ